MTPLRLAELFPREIAERLETQPALVMPLGTIEWHSHHLPLGLDGLVADDLCAAIAERTGAILAPTSYWAVGGVPFPYTLELPIEVIEPVLVALFEQYGAMGFRVITVLCGHFGLEQTLAVKRAAVRVMDRSSVIVLPITEYELVTDHYLGDHAGVGETSLLWASRPDLVRLDAVPADQPLEGVTEDPRTRATRQHGELLRELIVERVALVSMRLLDQTDAVARRRFIEAQRSALRVLEAIDVLRRSGPRSSAPAVVTPAYAAHCEAVLAGDYLAARSHADAKLADPWL